MSVIHGDCLERMAEMEADSIDAIVTDPPYGLAFMGKAWDHGVPGVPFWVEALRVAKPGAHLVAFGGTRTYHRLACAIEDAGWEIRDCLSWLYGSGFPKSLDVSKAIDKAAGCERPRVAGGQGGSNKILGTRKPGEAISGEAIRWQGWGTALKPAWEPIILARKPLAGTVAANVQRYGTGAINVDGCRIGTDGGTTSGDGERRPGTSFDVGNFGVLPINAGRWPANVCLDEEAAAMLDAQSGERVSGSRAAGDYGRLGYCGWRNGPMPAIDGDSGGASRFFYTAKASRGEREDGLYGVAGRKRDTSRTADQPSMNDGAGNPYNRGVVEVSNHHPTVKPVALMRWLVRLVTPRGGVVLDPFLGSGTTGVAAKLEGFRWFGIEREAEYVEIARRRTEAVDPLFSMVDA